MFNLTKIRELILRQDKELEKLILEFSKFGKKSKNILILIDLDENFELDSKLKIQLLKIKGNILVDTQILKEHNILSDEYKCYIDTLLSNNNCVVIYNDSVRIEILNDFKERALLVYYINNIKKKLDSLNESSIISLSNILLTDSIETYIYKKMVENIDFIYLDSNFILNKVFAEETITDDIINNYLGYKFSNLKDRYLKGLYAIANEFESIKNSIDLFEYLYKKYNTKEVYNMYIHILSKSKDYMKLVEVVVKSDYTKQYYKAEIVYLESVKRYELLEFIVDISIDNYKVLNCINDNYHEYKLALYHFIMNNMEESFDKYSYILDNNEYIFNSPLVNRNISHILEYMNNNKSIEFYNVYKELEKECLNIARI